MLRDRILKTKRDELATCITSRKRKLQELYSATVVFATEPRFLQDRKNGAKWLQHYSEPDFLEANNIVQGRFFDTATLQQLPGPYTVDYTDESASSAKVLPSYNQDAAIGTNSGDVLWEKHLQCYTTNPGSVSAPSQHSRKEDRHRSALQQKISTGIQVGRSLIQTGTDTDNADLNEDEGAKILASPSLNAQLPEEVTSTPKLTRIDDYRATEPTGSARRAVDNPAGISHDHNINGGRGSPNDTSLSSEAGGVDQAHQQDQGNSESVVSSGAGISKPQGAERQDHDNSIGLDNGTRIDTKSPKPQSQPDVFSEPQLDLANSVSLKCTPSTPDEQLRLEEAQFMKPSQRFSYALRKESQIPQEASSPTNVVDMTGDYERNSQLCRDADDSSLISRRNLPPRDQRIPGMTRDISKDLMLSQRPPMRIDTGVTTQSPANREESARIQNQVDIRTPSSASTPLKPTPTATYQSPPERMTTRVSSGALRHKSVSEILGETPKIVTHQGDRSPSDRATSEIQKEETGLPTPRYGQVVTSPDTLNFRSRLSELKEREKERSKLSTVVFARQQPFDGSRSTDSTSRSLPAHIGPSDESKDYLVPLFTAQASAQQPSLSALMGSAHKTLTTPNQYLEFHEQQDCRILKRIYHLQNSNRWSLRQLERAAESERPISHWDVLLSHMKWMRTDFREERKWKITVAKNLADWCSEWVSSPQARRALLQVKVTENREKAHASQSHATPVSIQNNGETLRSENTPELVPSTEDDLSDTMDEESNFVAINRSIAPAAIFSLASEDVYFGLEKTSASDKLLSELPMYEPCGDMQELSSQINDASIDSAWKASIVPISKFVIGKMVIKEQGSLRKRSRYEYEDDFIAAHDLSGRLAPNSIQPQQNMGPENEDVALFNPENQHIIDRLHAAHAFRPPSEFNMPSQTFFESRSSSQWTFMEDDELRKLVREYAYNWSLISNRLSSPSLFTSGAERRTPWECFERWVGFEGLPGDMSRTQYFRTWNARRDAARHHLNQQFVAHQQAHHTSQSQLRRKNTEPMRVERRRNSKHLALVHAMQKVAKKKETTIQKQQHVASLAAMRKAAEASQPRQRMQTPQEFSRFKYERELKIQEKQEQYRAQMLLQQRNAIAQQKAMQQAGQQHAGASLTQPARSALSGSSNNTSPHLASSLPSTSLPNRQNSQGRPLPPSQTMVNGGASGAGHPSSGQSGTRVGGAPQAPMQSFPQGQPRLPLQMVGADNLRIFQEANRLQAEQQQYLQQQRQQRYPQANSLNGISSSPHTGSLHLQHQNNAGVLSNLPNANGAPIPSTNGVSGPSRQSPSPGTSHGHQLSNGSVPVINQFSDSLRLRHPQASPEQIKQLTSEALNRYRQHSQATGYIGTANMAGSNGGLGVLGVNQPQTGANYNSGMLNPQIYAQYMHSQQPTQQNRNIPNGVNGARPLSRDATPQMRNGNGQAGTSQSPRPAQAQIAGAE